MGEVIFEQSLLELKLVSAKIHSKDEKKAIGGWTWVANGISEDGKEIHTVFRMTDLPDVALRNKRSHDYGHEHFRVTAWEDDDPSKRPVEMECLWYDCVKVNSDEPLYIGRTTYKRRPDSNEGWWSRLTPIAPKKP